MELGEGTQGAVTSRPLALPILRKGPSPSKVSILGQVLKDYPDREVATFLYEGFKCGFRIPATGDRIATWSDNLKSVREDIVKTKIQKEVTEGRVLRLFPAPPMMHLRVSPLGVVPKKTPGEF